MTFLRRVLPLVVLICLGVFARAAEEAPVQLVFEQLNLTDGRRLRDVTVKAFNPDTGKLLVLASRKATTIPIELVPEPLREKLRTGAPRSGETLTSVVASPVQPPPTQTRPGANATPSDSAAADERVAAEHEAAARERASNYYRYEFPVGSGATRVTALNLVVDSIEPVSGWTGRYRSTGKVFLEFFDSKGYSFNRTTSTFEVLTERKQGRAIDVVDFTRKN